MQCPNCGKDNLEGAQVCAWCGAELQRNAAQPLETSPAGRLTTNSMAVWSLVLGVAGCLTCITAIPGLILGILGLNQINARRSEYTGQGLAVAGIVISSLVLVINVLILPAILFPVFARARESARTAKCINNVKQIGMCMRMYQTDWNEAYPPAAKWNDALRQYKVSSSAYVCPAAPAIQCGYGMNGSLGEQSASAVTMPAETVALFESDRGWDSYGGSEAMITKPRHREFSVGYADGHAASVADTFGLRWMR